jgi:hypothetical protein
VEQNQDGQRGGTRAGAGTTASATASPMTPRRRMTSWAAAAAVVLARVLATPGAAAAASSWHASAQAACATEYRVTGRVVAVRRPAWNDGPVARPNSPVDHYVHRGDVLVSCVEAIGRAESGPAYRKCGRTGSVWRVVRGGQIPATCVKRV